MDNLLNLYLNNEKDKLKEYLKDNQELIQLLEEEDKIKDNESFNKAFKDFIKKDEFNELINDKEKMKKIISYYHNPRLALQDDNVIKLLMETIKYSNKKE